MYCAGFFPGDRCLIQRLVAVRIELLTRGVERFDMVFEERLKEQTMRHLDARVELSEVRLGRFF